MFLGRHWPPSSWRPAPTGLAWTTGITRARWLGGWIGKAASKDVGVSEGGWAVCRDVGGNCRCGVGAEQLPVGVDRRADGGVAGVVPHGGAVGTRGGRVDVVPEELGGEPVLAGAARVPGHAPVDLREAARGAAGDVGVQHHADQATGGGRGGLVGGGECVVDDIDVGAIRGDGRGGVVAEVARRLEVARRAEGDPPSADSVNWTCGLSVVPVT